MGGIKRTGSGLLLKKEDDRNTGQWVKRTDRRTGKGGGVERGISRSSPGLCPAPAACYQAPGFFLKGQSHS